MKKTILLLMVIATAGTGQIALGQKEDEVRGSFLTTRPKASAKTDKPGPAAKLNRRRPKKTSTTPSTAVDTTKPANTSAGTRPPRIQRMGLGMTLFIRDSNGLAVRVDPNREFKKGDRVRLLIETNADGYLYVFNTTNDGEPLMIYPDPELDEAGNHLQGHVPFEIPSSIAEEERLRWFSFDQAAGVEKLYLVFSREPLPSAPIEDDLISFCRENASKCPWRPAPDVWAQIKRESEQPNMVTNMGDDGRAQTAVERQAVTRGIGLNRDDPEPSLIMLTASTDKKLLVATIALLHKGPAAAGATEEPE